MEETTQNLSDAKCYASFVDSIVHICVSYSNIDLPVVFTTFTVLLNIMFTDQEVFVLLELTVNFSSIRVYAYLLVLIVIKVGWQSFFFELLIPSYHPFTLHNCSCTISKCDCCKMCRKVQKEKCDFSKLHI